jgi:DNA-directed RNA polymerase specialized sigma24 family protein
MAWRVLRDLIKRAKEDKGSMLELLTQFKPLLRSRALRLGYPEAEQDLVYHFVEIIHGMDLKRISPLDGKLVSYLAVAVNNASKKLSYQRYDYQNKILLTEDEMQYLSYEDSNNDFWDTVKQTLTEIEYKTVVLSVEAGFSDIEIARQYGVTRQTVRNIKVRAYNKLRENLSGLGC